jgi:hypothetical protein
MYNGSSCDFGDPGSELVTEKLALAVDHIRLPVDDVPDQLVTVGHRHPHIGVYFFQRYRAYIGNGSLPPGVKIVGNGQNLYVMTLGGEFIEQVLDGSDHTVGIGGIQIRCDQNLEFFI